AAENAEGFDETPVARIGRAIDALQAARSVDMRHRRDGTALFLTHLIDLHHEGNVTLLLEPLPNVLVLHRRRERPEALPALDLQVEDILHVGTAWIAHDRAVAEGAWPPFHSPLKPADDIAPRDGLRRHAT